MYLRVTCLYVDMTWLFCLSGLTFPSKVKEHYRNQTTSDEAARKAFIDSEDESPVALRNFIVAQFLAGSKEKESRDVGPVVIQDETDCPDFNFSSPEQKQSRARKAPAKSEGSLSKKARVKEGSNHGSESPSPPAQVPPSKATSKPGRSRKHSTAAASASAPAPTSTVSRQQLQKAFEDFQNMRFKKNHNGENASAKKQCLKAAHQQLVNTFDDCTDQGDITRDMIREVYDTHRSSTAANKKSSV